MDPDAVRERAAAAPTDPGCYQFLDGETILYVGKAVDLSARVRSYADPRSHRVAKMVATAGEIEFAVTDTETQALLLEANLIKRYQPRYNVRLKDDKSYPLVQLTDHPFPRIEVTRDPNDSAVVFGPFTRRARVDVVVKALREVFGLRDCSAHKYANRARPCLDHDLGLCDAPCTDEVSHAEYEQSVEAAMRFLEGETAVLAEPLRSSMEAAARDRRFERAGHLRDRLDVVESFHADAASPVTTDAPARVLDVIGAAVSGDTATVARLHSEGGQLVDRDRHQLSVPPDGTEGLASVLAAFIAQYYAERELPDEILVPEDPADPELTRWLGAEGVAVTVPAPGRKATLVELALKNARTVDQPTDAIAALGDALGIDPPRHIEGFDVSHAQGRDVVGSNVAFVDGDPRTDRYRRKKLDETNDDYANIRALVAWRARRGAAGRDERPDPDLLVIDGGASQRAVAAAGLAEAGWSVPVIGIAKSNERVFGPDGPVNLSDGDPALHLVQRVRDEAHRFAVQYHQAVRDDVSSGLEEIDGIGPARRRRLLRRFGSLEGIRNADPAELETVEGIGPATAEQLSARL